MYDEIKQVIAQLEKHGMALVVFCDHLVWRITTAYGDEMVTCNSAKETLLYLHGALCFADRSRQFA